MRVAQFTPDVLVVGAGFAGSVCARVLADAGLRVLLIDRRSHLGGNAHDMYDTHGILIHPYGPHIFHTNDRRVLAWLSRFTEWRFYEHRVLAEVNGALYPIPINRTTINRLYRLSLTESEVEAWLKQHSIPCPVPRNSEDVALSRFGPELTDLFIRGYTRKQWGRELSELGPGVLARIPVRTDDDDRYFTDTYQLMPLNGYFTLFARMLDHPNIQIRLETDYQEVRHLPVRHTVYTGPIDEFFDYCYGPLPYRSLRFVTEHLPQVDLHQPVAVINYPDPTVPYTRCTEFKHLTGQRHAGTTLMREYPCAEGDPYYPVPAPENEQLYQRYVRHARQYPQVSFLGRLAQYRYYNMDQVVAAALTHARALLAQWRGATEPKQNPWPLVEVHGLGG